MYWNLLHPFKQRIFWNPVGSTVFRFSHSFTFAEQSWSCFQVCFNRSIGQTCSILMADYTRVIACDCPPKFSLLRGSLQAEVDAHIQASEAAACRQTGGCMVWRICSCDALCFMIVHQEIRYKCQKTHFYCITGLVDERRGSIRGILWPHPLISEYPDHWVSNAARTLDWAWLHDVVYSISFWSRQSKRCKSYVSASRNWKAANGISFNKKKISGNRRRHSTA